MYNWTYIKMNQTMKQPCRYGIGNASRACILDKNNKFAMWENIDLASCRSSSETTKKLENLLKNLTTSSTNKEVITEQVSNITKRTESLTANDIILAHSVIYTVSTSANVSRKVAQNVMNIANHLIQTNETSLMEAHKSRNTLNGIVNSLEILADNIEIVANVSTKDNVTLWEMSTQYIALASMQDKTGRNMSIMVEQLDGFPKFEIGKKTPSFGNPTLEIKTPDSLFLDARKLNPNITVDRLNMLFFNRTTFFPIEPTFANKREPMEILSNAFSVKVGKIGQMNLSNDIVWSIQLTKIKPKEQLKCAYWNTVSGTFSSSGCTLTGLDENVVTCSCNHLTTFAVIFDPESEEILTRGDKLVLTLITYIGCGISILGISFTIASVLMFKFLRRNTPSKILLGLCISLGLLLIIFVSLINRTEPELLCTVTAAMIQYFVLSTFCWMVFEAITLYLKVVRVIGEFGRHFFLKASIFSFGVPAIFVGVFMKLRLDDYGNDSVCAVQDFTLRYGLVIPVCVMLLFNVIIFFMVLWSLYKQRKQARGFLQAPNIAAQLRIAASCCTLLGLAWIFGLLSMIDSRLIFQYLFCFCNSLQGLFLFYFNVLRQTRIREAWLNCMKGKDVMSELNTASTFRSKNPAGSSDNGSRQLSLPECTYDKQGFKKKSASSPGYNKKSPDRSSERSEISFSSYTNTFIIENLNIEV